MKVPSIANYRDYLLAGICLRLANYRDYLLAGICLGLANYRDYLLAGICLGLANYRDYLLAGICFGLANYRDYLLAGICLCLAKELEQNNLLIDCQAGSRRNLKVSKDFSLSRNDKQGNYFVPSPNYRDYLLAGICLGLANYRDYLLAGICLRFVYSCQK
jgi:phage shock protein PspC (stress-responsive transcriptional regulator)